MKSILQTEKMCWYTGDTRDLHKHHIFGGAGNRKLSEKYGLWVWLRADKHTGPQGVHENRALDLELKRAGQEAFERTHSREEFMRIFGRNWL